MKKARGGATSCPSPISSGNARRLTTLKDLIILHPPLSAHLALGLPLIGPSVLIPTTSIDTQDLHPPTQIVPPHRDPVASKVASHPAGYLNSSRIRTQSAGWDLQGPPT